MHEKPSPQTAAMPWSRLLLEFDLDSTNALAAGARSGKIEAPAGWTAGVTTDAEREVDILRMETVGVPSVEAGAQLLRSLVACGAITRPVPDCFVESERHTPRFQPDPARPLQTKKALAELLGWEGLSIAVPTFSGSGAQAVCITIPHSGRLIEANIPAWDSDWSAYGDLILEHQIQVSPGTHCVTAGAVSASGQLISGTYDYVEHPDKHTATRFAAMATCVAKLELDAQARPTPTARSFDGPN
jgi:hypothetical protein